MKKFTSLCWVEKCKHELWTRCTQKRFTLKSRCYAQHFWVHFYSGQVYIFEISIKRHFFHTQLSLFEEKNISSHRSNFLNFKVKIEETAKDIQKVFFYKLVLKCILRCLFVPDIKFLKFYPNHWSLIHNVK